ncbi:hypothetical protein LXD69_01500 [Flavobacterium sediminilitoris]|uniref:Natural product n=1 Tax=Flavobacterium sediminilitoris TaxID=2024526 RepID=A0ABY4HPH6_9FLAO|nr:MULTISPECIES: hypothetical protein [Flavobacterium]UOX34202.1 hypothetical protein LXD69_01500 [Flavobacterium sediminilitoris]
MKKSINQLKFEKLSKNELMNINSIEIEGASGKNGGNPDGLVGPCGTEPSPNQPNYEMVYLLWKNCVEMYENPAMSGNCIF